MTDRYLPVHRVAQILSCSRAHVYELMNRRQVRSIKIGERGGYRISEESLCAFIERREFDPEKEGSS